MVRIWDDDIWFAIYPPSTYIPQSTVVASIYHENIRILWVNGMISLVRSVRSWFWVKKPLWKNMSSSVGMMTFPTEWPIQTFQTTKQKINSLPKHVGNWCSGSRNIHNMARIGAFFFAEKKTPEDTPIGFFVVCPNQNFRVDSTN